MSDSSLSSKKYLQHIMFNGYDVVIKSNIPPGYMKTLSLVEQMRVTDEIVAKIKQYGNYEYRIASKMPFTIHVNLSKSIAEPIEEELP